MDKETLQQLWARVRSQHRLPSVHVSALLEADPNDLPVIEYSLPYVVYSGFGTILEQGVLMGDRAVPNRPAEAGAMRGRLDQVLSKVGDWHVIMQDGKSYVALKYPEPSLTSHGKRYEQRFDDQVSKSPQMTVEDWEGQYEPPYEIVFLELLGPWEGQESQFVPWLYGLRDQREAVASISVETWHRESFLGLRDPQGIDPEDAVHMTIPGRFPGFEPSHPDLIDEDDEETSEGLMT